MNEKAKMSKTIDIEKEFEVYHEAKKCAINDILCVLGDKKMYINQKKLFIEAIDKLYRLDYYEYGINHNGNTSLYRRFIQ